MIKNTSYPILQIKDSIFIQPKFFLMHIHKNEFISMYVLYGELFKKVLLAFEHLQMQT